MKELSGEMVWAAYWIRGVFPCARQIAIYVHRFKSSSHIYTGRNHLIYSSV